MKYHYELIPWIEGNMYLPHRGVVKVFFIPEYMVDEASLDTLPDGYYIYISDHTHVNNKPGVFPYNKVADRYFIISTERILNSKRGFDQSIRMEEIQCTFNYTTDIKAAFNSKHSSRVIYQIPMFNNYMENNSGIVIAWSFFNVNRVEYERKLMYMITNIMKNITAEFVYEYDKPGKLLLVVRGEGGLTMNKKMILEQVESALYKDPMRLFDIFEKRISR